MNPKKTNPVPQPPKMREHWWQLWLPKYVWIQQQGFNSVNYHGVPVDIDRPAPKGRVVVLTERPLEFSADTKRTGGRMVRRMPKQLKKIKDAQEKANE